MRRMRKIHKMRKTRMYRERNRAERGSDRIRARATRMLEGRPSGVVPRIGAALVWLALLAGAARATAQEPSRAELLEIAREVVEAAAFVSLATLDDEGYPAVRAMDPLPPDEDWVVWLATNPGSRKVEQLRARPRVALHYLVEGVPAYVTLIGRARLVDDPETKARHWKESWTPFYPDRGESVLLIEVTPIRLEVVSESHGAPGDPETWRAHVVEFRAPDPAAHG